MTASSTSTTPITYSVRRPPVFDGVERRGSLFGAGFDSRRGSAFGSDRGASRRGSARGGGASRRGSLRGSARGSL
ncbi:MAG TPA: hypothetical protein VJ802_16880, partial [Gemmatimonadaceae bacterium]|nr:hypothetical protein [Gemmatimonadaceae bacterium]